VVGASAGDLDLGFLVRGGRGSRSDCRAITVLIRRSDALSIWIMLVCGCSCESKLQAQCSPVVSRLLFYYSKTTSTVAEAKALSVSDEHDKY
jgi:hypothetical protein